MPKRLCRRCVSPVELECISTYDTHVTCLCCSYTLFVVVDRMMVDGQCMLKISIGSHVYFPKQGIHQLFRNGGVDMCIIGVWKVRVFNTLTITWWNHSVLRGAQYI